MQLNWVLAGRHGGSSLINKWHSDLSFNFHRDALSRFFKFILFPLLAYFVCFAVSTYPLITQFFSRFYGDEGDGVQNLWNIWHFRRAITSLSNPYFSSMIHFPEGTSLAAHTLSPVNAVLGVILESVLNPFQAFNLMIIIAVVTSGLAAFLLAWHFCRSYWPSMLAGFVYAFSGFMTLHLHSHINVISLEWLPLLLLFWHRLLIKPRCVTAALAALFFILNFYSDLYYAFYAVLLIFIFSAAVLVKRGEDFSFTRRSLAPIFLFVIVSAAATSPFLLYLFHGMTNAFASADKTIVSGFADMHDPVKYSSSLFSFFIPGPLNNWFYKQLTIGEGLGTGFIGLSVWILILAGFVWKGRREDLHLNNAVSNKLMVFWLLVMIVFLSLSLGPTLHFVNSPISFPMPYSLLTKLIFITNLGGVPDRMMAIAILAASMLCALSLTKIEKTVKRPALAIAIVFICIFAEYIPWHFPFQGGNILNPPAYAYALKKLPPGAVFDDNDAYYQKNLPGVSLFAQMIHGHPIYGGYISRRPMEVAWEDQVIYHYFKIRNFQMLCNFGFRYVVTPAYINIPGAKLDYSDTTNKIFDLDAASNQCGGDGVS